MYVCMYAYLKIQNLHTHVKKILKPVYNRHFTAIDTLLIVAYFVDNAKI